MRFVEWNCRSRFEKKLPALEALRPDVAILCEAPLRSPYPGPTLLGREVSWVSRGAVGFKSAVVAGFGFELSEIPRPEGVGAWAVAVDHPAGFGVLGIWSCPAKGRRYSDEIIAVLDAYEPWLSEGPVVVAGDFNLILGPRSQDRGAIRVLRRLEELGLMSAYHAHLGIAHGDEPIPTHYFRTHEASPFHIDFVFVPASWRHRIRGVEIGTYADWVGTGLSDHVPIVVELAL